MAHIFNRLPTKSGGGRKSAFQQHIHSQENMLSSGRNFVDRTRSVDINIKYIFDGADFDLNGSALPYSHDDAVRFGSAAHRGNHPAYTEIVGKYRDDLLR